MADVADTLPEWSTTLTSNGPVGATAVGTGLAPNLQQIQAVVKGWLASKGADIASASTTDLGAVAGLSHDITGTTTITSFGTIAAGTLKIVKFEGALTLTHNATSLILPGAANVTTADGDIAIVISEGSGNWRCVSYVRADGDPLLGYAADLGASMVLLSAQTASSSSALNFTSLISSTYESYILELVNIAPATDGVNLLLRASTDNGSSYLSGTEYNLTTIQQSAASVATLTGGGGNGGSAFILASGVGNASNRNVSGQIRFRIRSSGQGRFSWETQYTSDSGNEISFQGKGSAGAGITALRLLMSSGNIASGAARLYGLKSS